MDDFKDVMRRLDARVARLEEHLEAVIGDSRETANGLKEQARRLEEQAQLANRTASRVEDMGQRMNGMVGEFRCMRTDLVEFSGMVQGFGAG